MVSTIVCLTPAALLINCGGGIETSQAHDDTVGFWAVLCASSTCYPSNFICLFRSTSRGLLVVFIFIFYIFAISRPFQNAVNQAASGTSRNTRFHWNYKKRKVVLFSVQPKTSFQCICRVHYITHSRSIALQKMVSWKTKSENYEFPYERFMTRYL